MVLVGWLVMSFYVKATISWDSSIISPPLRMKIKVEFVALTSILPPTNGP
jgi:hypothetical protein